jgi:hypothetical protein
MCTTKSINELLTGCKHLFMQVSESYKCVKKAHEESSTSDVLNVLVSDYLSKEKNMLRAITRIYSDCDCLYLYGRDNEACNYMLEEVFRESLGILNELHMYRILIKAVRRLQS